ncbi:MAG: cupin domain-containing protein [Solirubrobacteraceae bacterium]
MVNVFDAGCEYDNTDPEGFRSGVARVGREAGGRANVVKLFEVPAGQSVCPYHYEYEEEWLLVLGGALTLREPAGERPLRAGDLVCFPAGANGAHQVNNRGEETARLLMWSSAREPAVSVYPDSDKIGVWPGSESDTLMLRRADGSRDYFDGET